MVEMLDKKRNCEFPYCKPLPLIRDNAIICSREHLGVIYIPMLIYRYTYLCALYIYVYMHTYKYLYMYFPQKIRYLGILVSNIIDPPPIFCTAI